MSQLENNLYRTIERKTKESVPKEIRNAIGVISLDENNINPFGSWTYKSQLYPADIDLVEKDTRCCNRNETIKFFVKGLQNIVRRIIKARGYYLGDIKAGLDKVFMINIGMLSYDKAGNPIITGYDRQRILMNLSELNKHGLLLPNEFNELAKLVKPNISSLDFENLYDALRDKWLLRWSGAEIMKGYKMLSGNREKTLAEAIQDNTLTKIDMWRLIYGRFLEITDVYVFYSKNKAGEMELLNYTNPTDLAGFVNGLKLEVQKYAFSKKYFKPFKLVKRMWSVARLTKDFNMIDILTPFMQSDIGRLSQISSDIETLIALLEAVNIPPIASILNEIDTFKWRLANVYQVPFNEQEIYSLIDSITNNKRNTKMNRNEIIKKLEYIKGYFKPFITDFTIKYLQKHGLYPPPVNYLP